MNNYYQIIVISIYYHDENSVSMSTMITGFPTAQAADIAVDKLYAIDITGFSLRIEKLY